MVSMMDFQAARWTVDHQIPPQEGNHHPTLIPMGCFETADGHLNVAGPSGRLWRNFCDAIGRGDLPDDERFSTGGRRSRHRGELNGIIADVLATRTTAEWIDVFAAAGVPAGPVYSVDQVFDDPQIRHLGMTGSVAHPTLGSMELLRHPVTMTGPDGSGRTIRDHTPDPGEHTEAVLAELGYSPDDVADLRARGVV
jgi:crotonobetainyl-CoA:carnitine CoA-transferase CaiB-like acyl-CoA transferase